LKSGSEKHLKWRDPETADEVVVATAVGPIGLTAAGDALTGVWLRATKPCGPAPARGVLAEAARQLASYFAGRLRVFDLPLAPRGTPFQVAVWDALRTIPYGETWSYADLARQIGRPIAVRAVGAANGQNPLPIVVPCHRVIGSNGRLVGFGGGLDMKRALLDIERGTLFSH
jgi:methylated-DNA-[protein]-cysteine S-methyltransferase